jgi:hypothetical protein
VCKAAKQHGSALVATAAVLHLLATEYAGRIDEWQLAADKARRFVEKNGGFDVGACV